MRVLFAVIVLIAVYFFARTYHYIFLEDMPGSQKPLSLPNPDNPHDCAKLYLIKTPYTCLNLKKGRILAKDVGKNINLPFDTVEIDDNVKSMVTTLNSGDEKITFTIQTKTEYDHHIIIEIVYILLGAIGRELDINATTLFKVKSEKSKLFVSECVVK